MIADRSRRRCSRACFGAPDATMVRHIWNHSKSVRWNRSKSSHSRHPVADGMAAAALLRPASPSLLPGNFHDQLSRYRRNRSVALSYRFRSLAGVRRRRGQRLHLSRNQADPAAVRRLHQGHRRQGQRRLGEFGPRAAHEVGRRQQPGRRAADGRYRPHGRGREGRSYPADQVGGDRRDRAGAVSRSGRTLGRHLDARARDLRLEGPRQAGQDHL